MNQDIGTSDGTGGQQNFLANIDDGDGATPGRGKLRTGSIEVFVKKNLGDWRQPRCRDLGEESVPWWGIDWD